MSELVGRLAAGLERAGARRAGQPVALAGPLPPGVPAPPPTEAGVRWPPGTEPAASERPVGPRLSRPLAGGAAAALLLAAALVRRRSDR